MNKPTKIILGSGTLLAVILIMASIFIFATPKAEIGAKAIQVEVVNGDNSTQVFEYHTDQAYLGAALQDEHLIEGTQGSFGLFVTTVNGTTANADKKEWWSFSKNNQALTTGADTTPIADGDKFEIRLVTGY